jgi:hypothetical protein
MDYLQINSYNLDIAKVFGVHSSIFLSYINSEYHYQKRLNNLNNNDTVSISRSEIYARTALNDEEQKEVEFALQNCGVISVKPLQNVPNKNYYILFQDELDNILNSSNPADAINNTSAKQFVKSPRVEPVSKRQTHIANLKKKIKMQDPVIQDYMCQWIDSVYVNPKGFLSPKGIEIAQEELLAYAGDNQDKQIAILRIAIKASLKDMTWAIERYEKQSGAGSRNFATYNDIKSDKSESYSGEVF